MIFMKMVYVIQLKQLKRVSFTQISEKSRMAAPAKNIKEILISNEILILHCLFLSGYNHQKMQENTPIFIWDSKNYPGGLYPGWHFNPDNSVERKRTTRLGLRCLSSFTLPHMKSVGIRSCHADLASLL